MTLNPFEGAFKLFEEVATGAERTNELREDVFNDKWDNIEVDTCIAYDTDKWETGIRRENDSWIIVKQYETRKQAQIGHKDWVAKMKDNPDKELQDINLWNI